MKKNSALRQSLAKLPRETHAFLIANIRAIRRLCWTARRRVREEAAQRDAMRADAVMPIVDELGPESVRVLRNA